MLDVKLVDLK